jgi:hypothetical protein
VSAGRIAALAFAALLTSGCMEAPGAHNAGIYLLLDTSGTYSRELDKAQQIINYTLSRLEPGDSFAVARIDTGSFSEKDIVAKVTLDDRPSTANLEKREFAKKVAAFIHGVKPSQYTDITGGLLQAVQFLNEKNPGHKTIMIFSDLEEDLEKGYVRNIQVSLKGFEVVALNVTKLRSDNIDPRKYLDRVAAWRKRVEGDGGRWRMINDLDRLEGLFDDT